MAESTQVSLDHLQRIESLIQSSNAVKKSTAALVKEFLDVQANFLRAVDQLYKSLDTIECVADIFVDGTKETVLKEFNPLEKVQIAICGYNSVGKTSFIHELLGCDDFLPVDKGAVTARIVKFSYAPQENACLIRYTSVQNLTEIDAPIDLSDHFKNGVSIKTRNKGLRKLVKEYVGRPESMDQKSDEFAQWAKIFVEIRLPSENLKSGLHVYDTPGFLGSDPPILRENLLALVGSVRPTLVFLYDNPTGSDDSRKCYNELKIALRSDQMGVDVFFLNTKADVAIMRKDASNNDDEEDDDDEKLINKERLHRYKLLMTIDEMKDDVHEQNLDDTAPSFDQCDSFDIFTSVSPLDPMELAIKRHAINRIICFAAEHDLRLTKYVISIVHEAIDGFFDFVLVTNRRSTAEWNKLRDNALLWGENFFEQYKSAIDMIASEANRRLSQRFNEKRFDIEKKAIDDCETRGIRWDERLDTDFSGSNRRRLFRSTRWLYKSAINLTRNYRSDEQIFIDIMVEREVIKPVLLNIIAQESNNIEERMNKDYTRYRSNNELLHAAYREVLVEISNLGDMNHLSARQIILKTINIIFKTPLFLTFSILYAVPFTLIYLWKKQSIDQRLQNAVDTRKQAIRHYLVKLEAAMSKMGDQVQKSMNEWINQEHDKYKRKVYGYHRMACRTIQDRQKAYELARLFVPKFARIECQLEANLHLAAHHGSHPVIIHDEVLGTGGFFTVHPASWDNEHGLVAKRLRKHINDQNFAYLEAHFHRKITKLNISHMIQLKYLYVDDKALMHLILSRYPTNLHSFLIKNMRNMTADKAIKISHDIASVIAHIHAFDLVHRDIKVENILMDEHEEVYLADFGTCQHCTENSTIVGSFPLSPDVSNLLQLTASGSSSDRQYSYEGTAVDVYLLGVLMFVCAPKDVYIPPSKNIIEQVNQLDRKKVPEKYCALIVRCLEKDSKQRPTAQEIVNELDTMTERLCIVCEDALRAVRFQPCGHKMVCVKCLAEIQQRRVPSQCIACEQVFTSVQEDNNTDTFFIPSSM